MARDLSDTRLGLFSESSEITNDLRGVREQYEDYIPEYLRGWYRYSSGRDGAIIPRFKRPVSARSLFTPEFYLMITYGGSTPLPAFRYGVH